MRPTFWEGLSMESIVSLRGPKFSCSHHESHLGLVRDLINMWEAGTLSRLAMLIPAGSKKIKKTIMDRTHFVWH